ncbi:Retrovirus-related Pol polyprotein from transposon opus, partial [Mucuna pruriens]
MISIFSNLLEDCMEVFMDDFMVYVESFEACLSNLSKVLRKCIESNLVLNFEKCHFMVIEGIVLGNLVLARGIEVDKAKIDVISSLSNPASKREVRSFLGHQDCFAPVQATTERRRLCVRLALRGRISGAKEKTHVRTHPPSTKLGTSVRVDVRRVQLYARSHPRVWSRQATIRHSLRISDDGSYLSQLYDYRKGAFGNYHSYLAPNTEIFIEEDECEVEIDMVDAASSRIRPGDLLCPQKLPTSSINVGAQTVSPTSSWVGAVSSTTALLLIEVMGDPMERINAKPSTKSSPPSSSFEPSPFAPSTLSPPPPSTPLASLSASAAVSFSPIAISSSQVTFLHKGFNKTRQLGLKSDIVRHASLAGEIGMLVVDSMDVVGPQICLPNSKGPRFRPTREGGLNWKLLKKRRRGLDPTKENQPDWYRAQNDSNSNAAQLARRGPVNQGQLKRSPGPPAQCWRSWPSQ